MPIRPFLHDEFFDPGLIEVMRQAFAEACKELGLSPSQPPGVHLLAKHIIDEAPQVGASSDSDMVNPMGSYRADSQIHGRAGVRTPADRQHEPGAARCLRDARLSCR